ncbi:MULTISPECIES: hypothetical protein [Luteimonas]|uniref:hypothetical protein n=1 Tax=Luteimonas TaxID=83614 RepID=UPI000C79639E|nr:MULTISPECIES: hypothetical protein [Luteimonas]
MITFDELQALDQMPLDRDIRWSHRSLGLDEDAFDGVHRRLERLEGAGRVPHRPGAQRKQRWTPSRGPRGVPARGLSRVPPTPEQRV